MGSARSDTRAAQTVRVGGRLFGPTPVTMNDLRGSSCLSRAPVGVRETGMLADAFRETIARGIGSAKAYGFGLLSIAPVNS